MSFAIVLEGMTIAAFLVLLFGGKQKREAGWGVLCLLVVVSAVVQAGSMSLIVRFYSTWPSHGLLTKVLLGIPLRLRPTIFSRMETRPILVFMYGQLGDTSTLCCGNHSRCDLASQ